jgi:very-short-patch-repair endonuclease
LSIYKWERCLVEEGRGGVDIYIKLINGVESIIEIDGRQHYVQVSNWNSPESTQIRDRRKEDLATENNHNLLRVNQEDVLSDKGDWDEIVDKFIKEVYESEGVLIIDDCAGGERYSEI